MIPRAIGVDPGEARVGLAISDELGMLAHPLETIDVRTLPGKDPAASVARKIAEIAASRGVATVVVGLPLNMDGSAGPAAEKARALATRLREVGAFEVIELDERMTTMAALRQFREVGRSQKKGRGKIDQAAAQIILQGWLDARQLRGG